MTRPSIAALSLCVLLAAPAFADEPTPAPVAPGWSEPPAPGAPVAQPPAPVATPVVPPPPSNLPPPIVRRSGQARPAATAQPTQPSQPSQPWTPPPAQPLQPMQPSTPGFPPPSPFPPPLTPSTDLGAPAPHAYAPPGPEATSQPILEPQPALPLAGGEASILSIVKEHNVPLSDGTLALRLRTAFRVDASRGGRYRVWITFFDRTTGAALRSTRPAFADPQGAVHVVTRPVDSGGQGQEFNAPLLVPYNVFPDPGAGRSTEVEARVELTRVDGTREMPVASSSTTFSVHGADATGPAPGQAPSEPAVAGPQPTTPSVPVTTFPAPK